MVKVFKESVRSWSLNSASIVSVTRVYLNPRKEKKESEWKIMEGIAVKGFRKTVTP